MADTPQDSGTITLPPPKPLISNELLSKALNDIVIPMAVKEIKTAAGITTHEKVNTKSGFGRATVALKDFIQGTFWVFLISMFCMMFTFIFYLWLRKVLEV